MTRENKAEKRNLQNCKSYFESVIEDMNNFYNNKQDEYELGGLFNYFLCVQTLTDPLYKNAHVISFLKAWGGPSYEFRYNPKNQDLYFCYMDWGFRKDIQIERNEDNYNIILSVLNQVEDIDELHIKMLKEQIKTIRNGG